jgi:hypothetical protein
MLPFAGFAHRLNRFGMPGLTIALITLLVSSPGATLETTQLAQKLKLRRRVEGLIQ